MKPFEITRVFDAPRDRVWKAWTEAERLKHWWGPKGFTVHTCKVDLRPGGVFLYGMKSPDGADMWGKFVYRKIEAPKRLEFIVSFSDPKTRVTVQWSPHNATDEERNTFDEGRASMQQGWTGTLDQLTAYVAKAG